METSSSNQSIVNISQLNIEELVRDIREEEAVRMLKKVMESNTKILELQKMLVILIKKSKEETRRRREEEE